MRIYYSRVVAFILGIAAAVLLIRYRHVIGGFLSNVERIGPYHSPEEQAMGLIALGLSLAFVLALVKILTGSGKY
ncbi:MAG: hypothetical protein O2960_30820 [Verrucomicrobia bacterium]|nr:hypothetical protein [Verrucomicrobiota bacterium]